MKTKFEIELFDNELESLIKFVEMKNAEPDNKIKWTMEQAIKVLFMQRLEDRLSNL